MPSIELPEHYGLVLACNIIAPSLLVFFAGCRVPAARSKYGVGYPFMYAIEGMKKSKGGKPTAGLVNPIPTAVCGALWVVGRISYIKGYNGAGGRYTKGLKLGALHFLGYIGVLGLSIYTAFKWM